jgi:peptide/nickel transport system permease protein
VGVQAVKNYFFRYLMQVIPVLLIITFIVFVLVYVAGDPVTLMLSEEATPEQIESLREALGLNKPFYVQYGIFLMNMLQGDFGRSFAYHQEALTVVLDRLPKTLLLGAVSIVFAVMISIPLGVLSATKRNSALDLFITGFSVLGKAMPNFWQAIMSILILAVMFPIFPVSGSGSWKHLILPALTLGGGAAAEMTRLIRSSMIEVLGQDYIRTAKSKGISDFLVTYRHAFKNCLIPVITIMATQVSGIVGGALITETIFAWPGMGQLLVKAISIRDMSVVQAVVFVSAFAIILMNFLADLTYRLVDPRIKYE